MGHTMRVKARHVRMVLAGAALLAAAFVGCNFTVLPHECTQDADCGSGEKCINVDWGGTVCRLVCTSNEQCPGDQYCVGCAQERPGCTGVCFPFDEAPPGVEPTGIDSKLVGFSA